MCVPADIGSPRPSDVNLGLDRGACTFGLFPWVLIREVGRVQTDTEIPVESLQSVHCVFGQLLVGVWIDAH